MAGKNHCQAAEEMTGCHPVIGALKKMEKTTSNQTRVHNLFFPLVLAYLVIPNLIFLVTWVRPWAGIPAATVVVLCSVLLVRRNWLMEPRQGLGHLNLAFVLVLAFCWTLLTGAGGFVPQEGDYLKHNLLFHDLVHFAWPVNYPAGGGSQSYLCYGLGYYLLPALGGRILGDAAMPVLSFLWTFAGLSLFFYWIAANARKPKTTLLIFLLFAATGAALYVLKQVGIPGVMDAAALRAKIWQLGLYHSYHDVYTKFAHQPQHALPAWLGSALLYETLWVKKDPRGALFIWSTCLFWSPLTSLGLLLVPLAAWRQVSWRAYFSGVNLVGGGILVLIMGIFYQGHVPLLDRGFLWTLASGPVWISFYCLFVVLELSPVLLLFLVDWKYRVLGEMRTLFVLASGVLLLLPLIKFGNCSDLRLQAGVPALLFASLSSVKCLQSELFSLKRPLFILLTGSLLIGAVYPLSRPWLNLMTNRNDLSYAQTVQMLGFRNLSEYKEPGFDVAAQYLGRSDSIAACWLLR